MSLVGFKANNHPQQVGRSGAKEQVDDRGTPWDFFNELNDRFHFTLDVAAAPHNAKCEKYYTIEDNGLEQAWTGRVWCNPPYSDIESWVKKAWQATGSCELVVMLLPANRTEQRWWQEHIEPARRQGKLTVEFLPGRLRFIMPGHDSIKPNQRPPFGCCLVIW